MDETAILRKTLNSGRGEVKRGAGGHDGSERLFGSDGREYMQDRSLGVILKEPESTYPMQYGGQDFSVSIHEQAQVGKGPKSGGGEARARSRGAINSLSRAEASHLQYAMSPIYLQFWQTSLKNYTVPVNKAFTFFLNN
jgi:hypothetical protein